MHSLPFLKTVDSINQENGVVRAVITVLEGARGKLFEKVSPLGS